MSILYQISFPDGKSYIGISTGSLARRVSLHRHNAKKNGTGGIHKAIREYGRESLVPRVLVVSSDWDYLCDLEKKAIVAFRSKHPLGYNMTNGGRENTGAQRTAETRARISIAKKGMRLGIAGRPAGWKHTDEAKAKIAEAGMGRVFSAERKAKIGASKIGNEYNLGKTCSDETKQKLSEAMKKRPPFSEEWKLKISTAMKGRPWSEARRAALKKTG